MGEALPVAEYGFGLLQHRGFEFLGDAVGMVVRLACACYLSAKQEVKFLARCIGSDDGSLGRELMEVELCVADNVFEVNLSKSLENGEFKYSVVNYLKCHIFRF